MHHSAPQPVYHGMTKHVDKEGGYAVWLPSDWRRLDMIDGHHGAIYTPYPDRHDTCISTEKRTLEYAVRPKDLPILRQGFAEGLASLPEVEIEWQEETITSSLWVFEARYTFREGEASRKRWTRAVYWGNVQLVLIAQGATPEEFEYWRPMFFNTLMTVEM
ncbi:MAG: hypothetical protein GX657_11875 [Chloroflexi bacterium]|nr:hypothetical protein [Chloroflexota bacterium]